MFGPHESGRRVPVGARLAVATLAAVSAAFEGGFRGCGTETSALSAPLPPGSQLECLVDSDCDAPLCRDARCEAGRCVVVETSIDRDGDGVVAAPCGPDCDDQDSSVGPFAAEVCNGRDDDCDGSIDEDAPADVVRYDIAASVLASAGWADLPGVLLVSTTPAGRRFDLEVRWYDLTPMSPFAVDRLATVSDEAVAVVTLATGDGVDVFWARPDSRVVESSRITVEHRGTSVELDVTPPTVVVSDVEASELRVVEFSGGRAILVESLDSMTLERARTLVLPRGERVPIDATFPILDIAARADRFYVPASLFELAVLDASGTERARMRLPDSLVLDPLASWNGRVVAATMAGPDLSLHIISESDGIETTWRLQGRGYDADIRLHPLAGALAVTRDDYDGLALDVLDAAGNRVVETRSVVADRRFPLRDVHATSEGLVVVATHPGIRRTTVAVLGCDERFGR